jgi:hypothetical protein
MSDSAQKLTSREWPLLAQSGRCVPANVRLALKGSCCNQVEISLALQSYNVTRQLLKQPGLTLRRRRYRSEDGLADEFTKKV